MSIGEVTEPMSDREQSELREAISREEADLPARTVFDLFASAKRLLATIAARDEEIARINALIKSVRDATIEMCAEALDEREAAHKKTEANDRDRVFNTAADHWRAMARESEKCARDVRALKDTP